MIPDLDIYRAANVIIKLYGPDAPVHAAMRADAMLETGDLDGSCHTCASLPRYSEAMSGSSPYPLQTATTQQAGNFKVLGRS